MHNGEQESATPEVFRFQLYVSGSTARSARAIANMQRICEEHLVGRHTYEVIDVYQNPEATRRMQIIATPTLVKLEPEPSRRVVGDLSDKQRVLAGLNILP
jgi:circadian clock protein KaiB